MLAGNLLIKSQLQEFDGHTAMLASENSRAVATPIFNFEVEDWHTYFVGQSRVWVHNASLPTLNPQDLPADYDNALNDALLWLRSHPNGDVISPPWLEEGGHWGGLGADDAYANLGTGQQVPGTNPTIFDLAPDAFPVAGQPRGGRTPHCFHG